MPEKRSAPKFLREYFSSFFSPQWGPNGEDNGVRMSVGGLDRPAQKNGNPAGPNLSRQIAERVLFWRLDVERLFPAYLTQRFEDFA